MTPEEIIEKIADVKSYHDESTAQTRRFQARVSYGLTNELIRNDERNKTFLEAADVLDIIRTMKLPPGDEILHENRDQWKSAAETLRAMVNEA